ncbi:hypothetical protein WJU16_00700 [Chitinophaga pollutisoli]|uniref:Uncharacterized protein n=1 Tax=Chitinophaga pollutisoli TaxID=3133966 RepID=A0ABZ2YQM6_9BACT
MELVIRNSSQHVKGYLLNVNNGKTEFKPLGHAIQFAVGASGFPQAGDSVYSNINLKSSHVKIWRNGHLQCNTCPAAPLVDTTAGKIIFRPALTATDRIYIEAYRFADFSYILWPAGSSTAFEYAAARRASY